MSNEHLTNETKIDDNKKRQARIPKDVEWANRLAQAQQIWLANTLANIPNSLSQLKNITFGDYSSSRRIIGNYMTLKTRFLTTKTGITHVAFRANTGSANVIFSILQASLPPYIGAMEYELGSIPSDRPLLAPPMDDGLPVPILCNIKGSFTSMDGEYRGDVVRWEQIELGYRINYTVYCMIEAIVIDQINTGELSFGIEFYHSHHEYDRRAFEDYFDENRIAIKLFVMCMWKEYLRFEKKINENNIHPGFQEVIFHPERYHELFDGFIRKYDMFAMESRPLNESLGQRFNFPLDSYNLRAGWKFIPLSVWEFVRIEDPLYPVWREIFLSQICSNLFLNGISPTFPMMGHWTLVHDSRPALFDNLPMKDKFRHSGIASEIVTRLKVTDRMNYNEGIESSGAINEKFAKLSGRIHTSIAYANSNIRLSNYTCCISSEYTGRTLRDIPSLIIRGLVADSSLGLIFSEQTIFDKHMFEYIYGFLSMNTKAYMIHGDPHINNVTINQNLINFASLYRSLEDKSLVHRRSVKEPKIAYIIGDDMYAFPHTGVYSTIIDFSRSIFSSREIMEHEFSERIATTFMNEQVQRVIGTLAQHFPAFVSRFHDTLNDHLRNRFPLMFKIISIIDTYILMSNIRLLLDVEDAFLRGKLSLASGAIALIDAIVHDSEALLMKNMRAVFSNKISNVDDIEWPNLEIINKHFGQYKHTDFSGINPENVMDVFNMNSDINFESESWDTQEPLLAVYSTEEDKHSGALHPIIEDTEKIKQTDESEDIDDLISKYAQQEGEYLKTPSWMLE